MDFKKDNSNTLNNENRLLEAIENLKNDLEYQKEEIFNLKKDITEKLNSFNGVLSSTINKNSEYFHNIYDGLKPVKSMIENQNNEIDRLREGYNNSIKKDLILKMLDLKKRIEFYTKKDNTESSIQITNEVVASSENMLKVLNYIFKTEGVKDLTFDEKVPLDSINPSHIDLLPHNCVPTDNTNIVGTVKETLENGCYMEGLDGNQFILKKALVTYYGENSE